MVGFLTNDGSRAVEGLLCISGVGRLALAESVRGGLLEIELAPCRG
jgi:hypothetical protein